MKQMATWVFSKNHILILMIFQPLLFTRKALQVIEMKKRKYAHLESILNNTERHKVINYSLLTKVVFSNNNVVVFVSIFSLMTCPFSLLYTTSVSATKILTIDKHID